MKYLMEKNDLICFEGSPSKISVTCETGALWVTQANDRTDRVLMAGESLDIQKKGKVAVLGCKDSMMSLKSQDEIFAQLRQPEFIH